MNTTGQKNGFSVKAYQGDAKTLLAFDLTKAKTANLAGFSISYTPAGSPTYYIQNFLRFKDPSKHVQDTTQPPTSSLNAPIHKFRWVHVPGSYHQGITPPPGSYTYTATPRYFDGQGSLTPIDPAKSVAVTINVGPFKKGNVEIGNTRGFTQSQAFVHRFGPKATLRPKGNELLFDTSKVSGKNSAGESYTFAQQYEWLGFTAKAKIFEILDDVLNDKTLFLDVFAYDLNEPDVMKKMLALAGEGRIRVILDDAALHHNDKKPKPEDKFEALFRKGAKKPAEILRGHFQRYAHHKVLVVKKKDGDKYDPVKVLTGSTNYSVTGLYVNSNHVLVFSEPEIAAEYAKVFEDVWQGEVSVKFNKTDEAGKAFEFPAATPTVEINFSPHEKPYATKILDGMAARIANEGKQKGGSVLFAVMAIEKSTGPVLPALENVHGNDGIFSYGISDAPEGIFLYVPGKKTGMLVTGKPAKGFLPPPFDQVPGVGLGHQVHHKFVVCGFSGSDPVVYCGSSNLALGGEQANGDNLMAIRDADVATVFVIEALALVDHFQFLDRSASEAGKTPAKVKSASQQQQAADAGWFLSTSDRWAQPYFDPADLHCADRLLFR